MYQNMYIVTLKFIIMTCGGVFMDENHKVLVVDDSAFILKAVERALKPHNFEIVGYANNGKLGLEMFEKLMPDIVILDITMPEMDGLEVADNLFKKYTKPNVVMLSALGENEIFAERAKEIGIKRFLRKPFKENELLDAINFLLQA